METEVQILERRIEKLENILTWILNNLWKTDRDLKYIFNKEEFLDNIKNKEFENIIEYTDVDTGEHKVTSKEAYFKKSDIF